jgi:hypothetical protein
MNGEAGNIIDQDKLKNRQLGFPCWFFFSVGPNDIHIILLIFFFFVLSAVLCLFGLLARVKSLTTPIIVAYINYILI